MVVSIRLCLRLFLTSFHGMARPPEGDSYAPPRSLHHFMALGEKRPTARPGAPKWRRLGRNNGGQFPLKPSGRAVPFLESVNRRFGTAGCLVVAADIFYIMEGNMSLRREQEASSNLGRDIFYICGYFYI